MVSTTLTVTTRARECVGQAAPTAGLGFAATAAFGKGASESSNGSTLFPRSRLTPAVAATASTTTTARRTSAPAASAGRCRPWRRWLSHGPLDPTGVSTATTLGIEGLVCGKCQCYLLNESVCAKKIFIKSTAKQRRRMRAAHVVSPCRVDHPQQP